uniref:Uncharacterized protein n=1 Tax=Florenciella parvula TaxID=236787 RepID=A0A7S2FAP8_9STRA|mmetsp:Transcript_12316/g.25915  ORF Transcript_12316/g.25915 Transcript_12316/m.25915 type:complete len:333 (+) Transcript_12316:1-999(+)
MLISTVVGVGFLVVGGVLRSVWWVTSDQPVEPPLWINIVVPFLMYALCGPVVSHALFIYILFWLQVIDVKRTTYIAEYKVKKAQAIQDGQPEPPAPKPLKPLSQEKIDKLGLLVLSLAKGRVKLTKTMTRVTMSIMGVNTVLIIIAAMLEGDSDVRACLLAAIWIVTSLTWLIVIYIIVTYGGPLVLLYGRKPIWIMYHINSKLMMAVWLSFFVMTIAELPGVDKSIRDLWVLVTWGIVITLLFIVPDIMKQLMKIPLAAMKRKKRANQKGQVLRKGSSSGNHSFSSVLSRGINIDRTRQGSVVMPLEATVTNPDEEASSPKSSPKASRPNP